VKSRTKPAPTGRPTGSTRWPRLSSRAAVSSSTARVSAQISPSPAVSVTRPITSRQDDGPSTSPSGGSFGLFWYASAAAKNAAVSRTERLTTPSAIRLIGIDRASSPSTRRPRLGFRPTSPQHAAGIRIEPPPSLACAIGTTPEATSTAAPPDDAPHEKSVCHGLRVGSASANSVVALNPNSGSRLLPSTVNPAPRYCLANRPCCFAGRAGKAAVPYPVGMPAIRVLSLTYVGTPRNGPSPVSGWS